ncbi:AAA family ATPase [Metallosphaera tengchongensis]|uniref:AAA family ATPase n=1 Tax=Metallosphaera tengchongensis TaxID=1532350 RepID=A0A6N0NV91_9CREN|nr:AAA family ATPase [Metallosphaera tengchongensis]QKR00117.1 AAA family ATPase [Metallosphaera tengchongensis]
MVSEFFIKLFSGTRKVKSRNVCLIDPDIMKGKGLGYGDTIAIIGNKMFPLLVQEDRENTGGITVHDDVLRFIGVRNGEKVVVRKIEPVPLSSVVLAPSSQKTFDTRRLNLELRSVPVSRGIPLSTKQGEFVVASYEPRVEVGMIVGETEIEITGEIIKQTQKNIPLVSLDDIGGLTEQIASLKEIIDIALLKPEVTRLFGFRPPKGVLLYGPPGTGKTLIAKALANSVMANFFFISGPEIGSKYYGESEKRLREIFEQAEKSSPSMVFIDEIDAIAPNRDVTNGEADKRIVAQLLTLMDGVSSGGGLLVIGATNRPNAIDPALRRPGRFDREIEIPVPDKRARLDIIKIHTRRIPLAEDVNLEQIASMTNGFVGADLEALVREATMRALRRVNNPEEAKVTMTDFMDAMKNIEPSALREFRVEIPNVTWEDIIGLDQVKQELREVVEWPLKYSNLYDEMRAEIPTGVMLYGPPGTGKTMLAKAVAHESGANFIAVSGPELMNMWVGETERAIREVFKRARQASPTVIFFDEIDAIATVRGSDPNRVTDRALSQMLTEMDGVATRKERVIFMAATNRPDIIDPAIIRPGRLEKLVYVPAPDYETRKVMFQKMVTRHPFDEKIDFSYLAKVSENFTPADIRGVVNKAVLLAIRRGVKENKVSKITFEDLVDSIRSVKPTVTQAMINYYNSFLERVRLGGAYS